MIYRLFLFFIILLQPALGNICKPLINQMERSIGAPHNLMYSVAIIESGQYNKATKQMEPTPWTINTGGKSYYFNTKHEAVAKVKQFINQGVQSIDVGCMQVNLYHHGHHFASIEDAFDPLTNVRYAASFLKSLMEESKSWATAVAYYHSRNMNINQAYQQKVLARWDQEKNRSPLSYGQGMGISSFSIPSQQFQSKLSYVPVPVRFYKPTGTASRTYRPSPSLYTARAGNHMAPTQAFRPVGVTHPYRAINANSKRPGPVYRTPPPLRPVGLNTYRPSPNMGVRTPKPVIPGIKTITPKKKIGPS